MELYNYIQVRTRQLRADPSDVTDLQRQMSPPASHANGVVLPTAAKGVSPRVYAATSSHSQPPFPLSTRVAITQLPSQPPSRPPTQPRPSASRSHPGSQAPGSILGPLVSLSAV
ncbi:hypothetical protein FIBSPDRAFT_876343 [Athelia psychrophila]|uniref:Uncharacterized protein n=1 Tax=Athelia psychrophila TaxID=1759441 RepID=A0A167WY64_9AGAM|nr:hypothetical protein FIBSPDRAFT_876343 [Fibularhizoctonia sp. CBS 109695]